MSKLVKFGDLKGLGVPYDRHQLWMKCRTGEFPPPVKLPNGYHVAYIRSEVEAWVKQHRANARAAEREVAKRDRAARRATA